jgi:hypothetical protein
VPVALRKGYTGTLLRPEDGKLAALYFSRGLSKWPATIDHAGLPGNYGDKVPTDKVIGEAVEAWYDDELGVVVLVKIFADRPEAAALARDIENGAIIGFSLYTDYEELVPEGAEYGDVIHIRVTHIGVTKNPAWARVFNDLPIDQQVRTG